MLPRLSLNLYLQQLSQRLSLNDFDLESARDHMPTAKSTINSFNSLNSAELIRLNLDCHISSISL